MHPEDPATTALLGWCSVDLAEAEERDFPAGLAGIVALDQEFAGGGAGVIGNVVVLHPDGDGDAAVGLGLFQGGGEGAFCDAG